MTGFYNITVMVIGGVQSKGVLYHHSSKEMVVSVESIIFLVVVVVVVVANNTSSGRSVPPVTLRTPYESPTFGRVPTGGGHILFYGTFRGRCAAAERVFGVGGNPLKCETPLTKETRVGVVFFSAAERNRAMIRQICGREPPERFKRQTTHGGRFVLFPSFPPPILRATRDSPREISL